MKKIIIACCAIALVQSSNAQTKKEVTKFNPPRIVKDVPVVEKVTSSAPVTKKEKAEKTEALKFTPPVIKKNKSANKPVRFAPPRIVKDESGR